MAKKKETVKKKTSFREAIGIPSFVNSEKTNFTVGILLLFISVIMVISFISFFSTGQNDQSIIQHPIAGDLRNENMAFSNTCGSIGAYIAYFFITCCFGFPAFLIPLFLIFTSLKLMGAYKVSLVKWFFGSMLAMIWCSVACAKFINPLLSGQVFNAGGGHGDYVSRYLESITGTPGLTGILIVTAIIFFTFVSSETITFVRKAMNPIGYISRRVKFNVKDSKTVELATGNIVAPETPTAAEEYIPNIEPVADLTENEPANTIDLTNEDENTDDNDLATEGKSNDDPDFTVVKGVQEEKASGTNLSMEEVLSTPINPREPYTKYTFPGLDLLKKYDDTKDYTTKEELLANKKRIIEVLNSFGVQIREITALL